MSDPSGQDGGRSASGKAKPLLPPPPQVGAGPAAKPALPSDDAWQIPSGPEPIKPADSGKMQARAAPEPVSENESTEPLSASETTPPTKVPVATGAGASAGDAAQEHDDAALSESDLEEVEPEESSTAEYKRPPALPRPKKLGESSKSDFREKRHERADGGNRDVSGSALPRGIKPPASASADGVPSEVKPDDTDVLIASVADELAAPPPSEELSGGTMVGEDDDVAAVVPAAASPSPTRSAAAQPQRPAWLLPAAAAAALLLVLAIFAWPSEQSEQEVSDAVQAVAAEPEPKPEAEAEAEAEAEERSPDPEPLPAPVAVEPSDDPLAAATDGEAMPAIIEGATEGGEPGAAEPMAVAEPTSGADAPQAQPEPEPKPKSKSDSQRRQAKSSKKRSQSSSSPSTKSDSPTPSASPSDEPSSSTDLLVQARAELRKGRASSAYSLARKSHSLKKTNSALVVMARAACRMKDAGKAKAAFFKLSLVDRTGIRSECRDHGVKLGI